MEIHMLSPQFIAEILSLLEKTRLNVEQMEQLL